MAGRLNSETKAPEVVEHLMVPFLKDQAEYFDVHLKIHKAHVVMLAETGLLTSEDARTLLAALLELGNVGQDGLELHPHTDLYMQMERFIIDRTGDLGGRLHTGRSRNDLYATASRLMTRDKLLVVLENLVELQRVLLERAEEHAGTVMPGYTHMQHAEPVTFGHYLLAVFDAITRDFRRISAAYEESNMSALGAAALAGSSFPLDRSRTAELLGCAGPVENTYDAVASRDYMLEAASALAILCATIARVIDHFILWVTSEHDMLDLPDGYCYSSSIMPQKRNPNFFLESLRSRSARVTGNLVAALGTLKGTIFAHSRDMSYEVGVPVNQVIGDATAMVKVMRGVIASVEPKEQAMLATCSAHFSGATELANMLVRDHGLPFRSAYLIVATLVRKATASSMRPDAVTTELLDEVSTEIIGRPLGLSKEQLQGAFDPRVNVEKKTTAGSPSSARLQEMLVERKARFATTVGVVKCHRASIRQADVSLASAIHSRVGDTAGIASVN